jgi:hypothetical protein
MKASGRVINKFFLHFFYAGIKLHKILQPRSVSQTDAGDPVFWGEILSPTRKRAIFRQIKEATWRRGNVLRKYAAQEAAQHDKEMAEKDRFPGQG